MPARQHNSKPSDDRSICVRQLYVTAEPLLEIAETESAELLAERGLPDVTDRSAGQ